MRHLAKYTLALTLVVAICGTGCGGSGSSSHPTPSFTHLSGIIATSLAYVPNRKTVLASVATGVKSVVFNSTAVTWFTAPTPVAGSTPSPGAGANASALAVSGDQSNLIASVPGMTASVSIVPIPSGTGATSFGPLTANDALSLAPIARTSQSFCLTANPGTNPQTTYYQGPSARGTTQNVGASVTINAAGNQLYGLDSTTGTYYSAAISSTSGVSPASTFQTSLTVTGRISATVTKVISDSGAILDAASGTLIAQVAFPVGATPIEAIALPGKDEAYFLYTEGSPSSPTYGILHYDVKGVVLKGQYQVVTSSVTGTVAAAVWSGNGNVTFATSDGDIVFVSNIP